MFCNFLKQQKNRESLNFLYFLIYPTDLALLETLYPRLEGFVNT